MVVRGKNFLNLILHNCVFLRHNKKLSTYFSTYIKVIEYFVNITKHQVKSNMTVCLKLFRIILQDSTHQAKYFMKPHFQTPLIFIVLICYKRKLMEILKALKTKHFTYSQAYILS